MITELLGLAGSGMAGSILGTIKAVMSERASNNRLELDLKIRQEARLNGQVFEHIQSNLAPADYGHGFRALCYTYCVCTLICFIWPDIKVHTFNPDEEPKTVSWLWGVFTYTRQITNVYSISTGGVGYGLLHPVAFQIGSVLLGPNAVQARPGSVNS